MFNSLPQRVGVISTIKGLGWLLGKSAPCSIIEVRLDYLLKARCPMNKIREALYDREHPTLLTLRSSAEGGQVKLTDKERVEILLPLINLCDAIDLEHASIPRLKSAADHALSLRKKIVLSAHYFTKAPTETSLRTKLNAMLQRAPAIVKAAVTCPDAATLTMLVRLQASFKKEPVALMGMGTLARESRQLLPLVGCSLLYGYLDQPTAPGQPAVRSL